MGVVYRAWHSKLNRTVALKRIGAGELASAAEVQRFHAEAEAAAHLDHPHIVPIYEVGEWRAGDVSPPVQYFTMKLIEGGSLAKWIADCRSQIADFQRQAARLLASVARAVHYAHQRGIIHRDLKPANILLQLPNCSSQSAICNLHSAIPLVSDFGLAKRVAGAAAASRPELASQSGAIVGTPSYMAPEQAAGSKGLTCSVDVFSLGTLLYELLAGQPPFKGATPLDTLLQVRECAPTRPRTLNAQTDRDLETICLKCLEKEPQQRYRSAEALAEDLERWLAGEPIQARPAGQVVRLWRWGRRNPLVASLSAVVLLVTLGGFFGVLGQWQVALANERKADERAVQAQEKEQEANQQRNEAQKQRDEVRALNDRLQRTLYAAHMNLANQAWDEDNTPWMLELLDKHRPKPGEPDLRGFEWHYLYRLSHPDQLTLKGHTSSVTSVAFSPDGKRLASGSGVMGTGGEVKVWDAQTGKELLSIKHPGKSFLSTVAFSPDGKRLVSELWGNVFSGQLPPGPGPGGGIMVWDAQTGQELLSLKERGVYSPAFSPDGKQLAYGSNPWEVDTNKVKVRNAQTGKEILSLKGHTASVVRVVFSPDGKRLASASGDKTVKVWNAQTGQEILSLKHTSGVNSVAFSPDGKRLASGEGDSGTVKVWDAQTGQQLLMMEGRHRMGEAFVTFSPDGKRLASGSGTGSAGGEVKVWDAQTGKELRTFKGVGGGVAFSPDGKHLAAETTYDNTVKVWDAQQDRQNLTLKGDTGDVSQVAFSPDGKRLASASADKTVKIWDVQTGQQTLTFKGHTAPVWSVAFSPDGKRLASVGGDRVAAFRLDRVELKVWDAQTGQELLTIKGRAGSVSFSPDGKRLVSLAWLDRERSEVKVWDAETGKELFLLQSVDGGVTFSPDGKHLAGSSWDSKTKEGMVKVWDAQSGQELLTLRGHTSGVTSVAFSHDGKRLAAASGDNTVMVWDAQTGQKLLALKDGGQFVAFSPDGKRLVSAFKVWDAQSGKELFIFQGGSPRGHVAFSPNGRRLASAGAESLRVWDAQTGEQLLTLKMHTGGVGNIAFSPDGHRLAGIRWDGTVAIWDATPLPEKP
jgi:WD40 repeat protein